MAFLTINGWEIPVKEIKETSEILGSYKRVFSGSMRSMVNAVKRRWNVTTNPLTLEEAEALKGYLKGEGVHWDFENNTLVSDKGHIPNTGYVATWMQNGGKYGSGVKVETNGNLYYSMGLESERGLTFVGYANLLTLPNSNYAPLLANGNNSLTVKDNKPFGSVFTTGQATISGTTTLSASTYYQLALTYNRSKIKIFCNGIKEGETTQTGNLLADWYSSIGMQFGGTYWTLRTTPADNGWHSVCYGNGLFVAVANSGTGNRVMTSPDGINWTLRTTPADNNWRSVCYGNGLFVAVADTGTGNRVMTSPDGINWTLRTTPADNQWRSVCYGNGLFVAVACSGTGNRVMTSPNGINWTLRTTPADNNWLSVCYGNGLFVAVANSGTGNRVMTSPDGINWTLRTTPADNQWYSVCYGNGLFVAVAYTGTGNRVMTSPDGINWTLRTTPADNNWLSVCYGNGLFVAVASSGTGNRVMTSPDGSYLNGIADCILYLPYSLPEAAILGLYNLGRDIPNLPKIYVSGDFIYPSPLEVLGEVNDTDYIQFWNNGVWTTGQIVNFTLIEV